MSSKKIVLTSSDGESFEVDAVVARKLQIVEHMMEDDCADKPILLKNVTGKILTLVIDYCKTQVDDDGIVAPEGDDNAAEEARKKPEDWDAEFMKSLDLETIADLLLAANFLTINGLIGLTSQAIADYIKDKTVEEVRDIFGIENDFTAEEEAKIREENAWAFDDHNV